MTTSFSSLLLAGFVLALVQMVCAIPWIWAIDQRGFRRWVKDPTILGYAGGTLAGLSAAFALFLSENRITETLNDYGRYYGAILHAQLALDFLVLAPQLLLLVFPKIGAVALSTFRECWRQPMFWLISSIATTLIAASMVIPYFTFGEDYKMMKQLGFDAIMLSAALFGLLVSSISINEEIEGRTAITVISKPINRRQFLIGKYLGTLLACWAMMLLLGWNLNWALYIKPHFDKMDDVNDTMPMEVIKLLTPGFGSAVPTPEGKAFAEGTAMWCGEALAHHVGLLLSFGQVMVLLAICTALATRMPFVVNLVICLFVFFIGRLSPVLVEVTGKMAQDVAALKLVSFIAQLFNALFPALECFEMGPAIVRSSIVPMRDFTIYVGTVFGYAVLYSTIGILLGLILFEDRDLA
ncbi:MAG: ABC transporter permease [Planctomycetes bacterium]|nr:ABC transporter permease [Planctomycetota bacterium]